MKKRPAKTHFRSESPVGRSGNAYEENEGQYIQKHNVFVGFLKVAQNGTGGWAYRAAEPAQRRLQHPAAAALAVGSKQCGRSQK